MRKKDKAFSLSVIRYADDFVILHENINTVLKCKEVVEEWLKNLVLELKPSKTRIAHTLDEYNGEKPEFNFLGFHIQHHKLGRHHSGKDTKGNRNDN